MQRSIALSFAFYKGRESSVLKRAEQAGRLLLSRLRTALSIEQMDPNTARLRPLYTIWSRGHMTASRMFTSETMATSIRQTLNFRNITQLLAVVNIEENRVLHLVL